MNPLLVFVVVMYAGLANGDGCDPLKCENYAIDSHYRELDCKSILGPDNCCPVRYECPSVVVPPGMCTYLGKIYQAHEELGDNNKHVCSAACRCVRDKFTCAQIECPDLFGVRPKPGCHFKYEHEKCCAVGEVCGPEAKSGNQEPIKTCVVEGVTYLEGQKIYPNDQPCDMCICQNNGEVKCKTINCGVELHNGEKIRKNCAPKYYGKNRCCPITWVCPNSESKIVPSGKKSDDDSHKCKFGDKEVGIGDTVEVTNERCTKCSCITPPMTTCIVDTECYEKI